MAEQDPPFPKPHKSEKSDRDIGRRTRGRGEESVSEIPIEEVQAGFGEATDAVAEGVPFMITRDMHQQLADLKYPSEFRKNLTPGEAHEIIASGVPYDLAAASTMSIDTLDSAAESEPSSRAEAKKKLSELLAKYGPETFTDPGTPEGKKALAGELREARAKEMADRLGISDKREAMLGLEDAYKKEIAANHGGFFNKKESKVAMAYAEARVAWTTALRESSSQLDGRRRLEAHAIGIRDTILREEALRQQGKIEGLSERGKTAMGTATRWGALPFKKAFQGYQLTTKKAGEGVASVHQFLSKKELNDDEKKLLAAKYTKAVRIISSAGVATVLFGGFGTLNVGLSFGLRAARGALGIAAGASVGAAAGQVYKDTLGEKSRLALRKEKRGVVQSVQDLLRFESAQQKGNRIARERAQKNVELAAAFITGAGFAAGSGAAIHTITGLEAVQKAAEDLEDASQKIAAAGASVAESAQGVEESAHAVSASAASVEAGAGTTDIVSPSDAETVRSAVSPEGIAHTIPSVPEGPVLYEAVIGKGEGFNQLIVDLRASGFTGFDPNLSASEISEKLGALAFVNENGVPISPQSAVMQVGDKLVVDSEGSVSFVRNGVSQLLFENKDGILVPHKLEGIEMRSVSAHIEPEHESSVEAAPEASAPAESATDDAAQPYLGDAAQGASEASSAPGPVEESVALDESVPDDSGARTIEDSIRELNEVPSQDEAPLAAEVSPDSTADARTIEDSIAEASAPVESFTNQHGIEIIPSVPATYEWKIPGTDKILTVTYGGSADAQNHVAHAYASEHPGSRVHFIVPVRDSLTGQVSYRLDAWDSVGDPSGQRVEGVSLDLGTGSQGTPTIGAQDLTRKLGNPYIYEAR